MTADPGQTPAGTGVGTADLTLDAAAATADVPAELLAQSLGQLHLLEKHDRFVPRVFVESDFANAQHARQL